MRKRSIIPLALLALLAIFFGWLYWRGTTPDTVERNPQFPLDGTITQLMTKDGHTYVRCALVVEASPECVWKVVRDYDSQADFLPYVGQIASTKLDEGRVRITGVAHSRIWGDWPFESVVTESHDAGANKYGVSWDERDEGELAVNRGSWTIEPLDGTKTLLVYTLQIEIPRYPPFLVRNILMNRVGHLLRSMRDEVIKRTRS